MTAGIEDDDGIDPDDTDKNNSSNDHFNNDITFSPLCLPTELYDLCRRKPP